MDITPTLAGQREVGLSLDAIPERLRRRLIQRIWRLTLRLETRAEARAPRGRTGRLRAAIGARLDTRADRIRGRVMVRGGGGKAGALEYGARRSHQVTEHRRTLDHVWGRATQPMEVIVGRYRRTANIAERRYLRGALDAMRGEALAEIGAAVNEA